MQKWNEMICAKVWLFWRRASNSSCTQRLAPQYVYLAMTYVRNGVEHEKEIERTPRKKKSLLYSKYGSWGGSDAENWVECECCTVKKRKIREVWPCLLKLRSSDEGDISTDNPDRPWQAIHRRVGKRTRCMHHVVPPRGPLFIHAEPIDRKSVV